MPYEEIALVLSRDPSGEIAVELATEEKVDRSTIDYVKHIPLETDDVTHHVHKALELLAALPHTEDALGEAVSLVLQTAFQAGRKYERSPER